LILDAAGRPDKWRTKAKKDHSCADRLVRETNQVFFLKSFPCLVCRKYWFEILYTRRIFSWIKQSYLRNA